MRAIEALQGIILLLGIGLLIAGPLQWVCTDYLRERLFRERDKLFDLAAAGKVGFDDPQYRRARRQLNALIRFAHIMSFSRLMMHLMSAAPSAPRGTGGLSSMELQFTDSSAADAYKSIVWRVHRAILLTMLIRSPTGWMAAFVVLGWKLIGPKGRTKLRTMEDQAAVAVQQEALQYRQPGETAFAQ